MSLTFGPMARLDPARVRWLVFHTVGAPDGGDVSAASIHAYHRTPESKGGPPGGPWAGGGYHRVIRKDGRIEDLRPISAVGSHTKGLNGESIGVAFSGNGDLDPLTPAQLLSAATVGAEMLRRFPNLHIGRVIGHRDVNELVDSGLLRPAYRTTKSCPGRFVDVHRIRLATVRAMHPPPILDPEPTLPRGSFRAGR